MTRTRSFLTLFSMIFFLQMRNNYPKRFCRRTLEGFLNRHNLPRHTTLLFQLRMWQNTLSTGFRGLYLPFAGTWDLMLSACLSSEMFNYFFFFFNTYNLINFLKIPVSHDTDIILLKVKGFKAEWQNVWWQSSKEKLFIQPQTLGVDALN